MTDPYKYPKLRWPLNIEIEKINNQQVLILRDPVGICESPLLLNAAVAPVLGQFEGIKSTSDILAQFHEAGLTEEILRDLITILDNGLMLESPKFEVAKENIEKSFTDSTTRKAANLGPIWNHMPEKLSQEVDTFIERANGILPLSSKSTDDPNINISKGDLCGLIAPHIDYTRGGECYGLAYQTLKDSKHTLYLVMGTAHQYSKGIFSITKKHFETPIGLINTEIEFVEKLANLYGLKRSFQNEFLHKKEHSLELQLPFIKRVRETNSKSQNYTIVPILVGSFHTILAEEKLPEEFEEYDSFSSALTECVSAYLQNGSDICVIAGVDMAHIGRAFGDSGSLTPKVMQDISIQDSEYLECVKNQDKKALFLHMAKDQNARKVCGFPTLYTVIDLFDRLKISYKTKLFDYHQAVDFDKDCAVTFAAMGMYK